MLNGWIDWKIFTVLQVCIGEICHRQILRNIVFPIHTFLMTIKIAIFLLTLSFNSRWLSIIHHAANHHDWGGDSSFTKCEHESLRQDEPRRVKWMVPGSLPHQELVKVITDKRIMKDIRKLNKFCHTGELETYHSMLTKYVPKRKHFSYQGKL